MGLHENLGVNEASAKGRETDGQGTGTKDLGPGPGTRDTGPRTRTRDQIPGDPGTRDLFASKSPFTNLSFLRGTYLPNV